MKTQRSKRLMLTASDLKTIHPRENGEPLVTLEELCPEILCDYRRDDPNVNKVLVRKSVADRLKRVARKLMHHDARMQLLVVEGYRSPAYQERYFLKELLLQYKKDPNLDFDRLLEEVHKLVALPSVAGHPTGGAIDLTIAYEGLEVDMGGGIADFSNLEQLPTYSAQISLEQKERRDLLHDLMLAEGFTPFYGEWWHFSYGDREWAAFYNFAETLYSPIFT